MIDEVVVKENEATFAGGGIFAILGTLTGQEPATGLLVIQDSVISANKAGEVPATSSSVHGGGIAVGLFNYRMLIDRSSIHHNEALPALNGIDGHVGSEGGGLHLSGISDTNELLIEIVNTTVSSNRANSGGGIAVLDPKITAIRHSTITDNHAGVDKSPSAGTTTNHGVTLGGGILINYEEDSPLLLDHTIVMGNTHSLLDGDIKVFADDSTFLFGFKNAVNLKTQTPNIAIAALSDLRDNGHYGGYDVNTFFQSIEAPEASLLGLTVQSSYVEDIGTTPTFTDGLISVQGTSITPGSLSNVILTHNGEGEAFEPQGAFVDAGSYIASNLPVYQLSRVAEVIGQAVAPSATAVIAFDQRDIPYFRVTDGNGDLTPRIDIGAIESQTPFLIGDYNRNGTVDAPDYTVWRDTLGDLVVPGAGADGNGDGEITQEDYDIWVANFGNGSGMTSSQIAAAFSQAIGDYNGDGVVDHFDYLVWADPSSGLQADGNGDGVVDDDDYDIWKELIGGTITTPQFHVLNSSVTGIIYVVTTTTDELDGDHSFGDLSLREAVVLANAETGPATIVLPEGRYVLTRTGSEYVEASYNDLDITGNVTIIGDGAGITVIEGFDATYTGTAGESEVFHITGSIDICASNFP